MTTTDEEFEHIVSVLLDAAGEDHEIRLALKESGITTSRKFDYLVKKPENVRKLRWTDPADNAEKTLSDESIDELLAIRSYRNQLQNELGPKKAVGYADITEQNREDFVDFVVTTFDEEHPVEYDPLLAESIYAQHRATRVGKPATAAATTTSRTTPAVKDWDKGTKRDISQFTDLSKDYQWDDWYRGFKATVHAQNVQKVLDPNYSPPSGSEEAEVFHRCNTYLYAVLVQRLKTVKGDELVRLYESSQDAQKVLELLVKHYQDSAAADIRATELFAGITGERIAESRRKPLVTLITEWNNKVLQYNKLSDNPMSPKDRLTHLKNYVSTVDELDDVSSNARIQGTLNGAPITPDKHYQLYLLRATDVDARQKREAFAHRRRIHQAEGTYEAHVHETEATFDYEAYLAAGNPLPRLSLDRETFHSLSPSGKKGWDLLSYKEKQTILGYAASKFSLKDDEEGTLVANMTDISNEEAAKKEDGEEQKLQAKTAASYPVPPAPIRKGFDPLDNNKGRGSSGTPLDSLLESVKNNPTSTTLMESLKQKRVSKEEARNLDPFDIRVLLNQNGEHSAHKVSRYKDYKEASRKEKEMQKAKEQCNKPAKKSILQGIRERLPPVKKTTTFDFEDLKQSMTMRATS